MIGIGPYATNYNSCFDQLLSFDDWTTGLGECRSGNPCWIVSVTFRAIGGYIRTETGFAGCSCCSCSWWSCVRSKLSYVHSCKALILSYVFYLGRTMQGLACAGFIPAGIGILAALYSPGPRKNRVFAAFSASQPLGGAIGSLYLLPP
jgi:MFS family permease